MTDEQFNKIINYIDTFRQEMTVFREETDEKLDTIYQTMDDFINRTVTIEDEFGFLDKQTTESLTDHEARIAKLELATK